MKIFITKSKSGHYTVTVKDENKNLVAKFQKLQSIHEARKVAAEYK